MTRVVNRWYVENVVGSKGALADFDVLLDLGLSRVDINVHYPLPKVFIVGVAGYLKGRKLLLEQLTLQPLYFITDIVWTVDVLTRVIRCG